jgi:GWxTD domain-containing protein
MSDIQFAWRIVPSEQPGKFLKSKNIVVPHPPRIYSAQNPMVYIYTEIYSETGEPQDLLYKIAVNDPLGNEVKNYPSSVENIQGKMIAYSKVINVASLKSNYYWLDIKLEKPDGTCVCEKRGLFQFKKIATDLISPDFYIIGLNSQELADYDGRFLKYFALKKDRDKYNELKNDSSKRLFIQDFWNNMAKNKGDDPVELRVKILNRYAYANNNYKYSNVDGWKSDRGRIYILYGPPADIEQVVFETTSAAREIWTLVIDGRLETFIFEDRAGNGQYELVDTTNKGEKGVIKYQGYQPTM